MHNTVLIDIDDCLLDWHNPFQEYIEKTYSVEFDFKFGDHIRGVDDPICYERKVLQQMRPRLDWSNDVDVYRGFGELVVEFNESEEFCRLPFMPDALYAIDALRDAGFEIHGLTCCGTSLAVRKNRQLNVGHLFDTIHYSDYKRGKKPFFETFYKDSGVMFLDDSPKHVHHALESGLTGFLMAHPHFENHHDKLDSNQIIRSWQQVPHIAAMI